MVEVGADGVWREDGREVSLSPGRGVPGCDVVFPVLHGPFGEDGTVQGLLEILDVAYVGAGVLASALCMDKVTFKHLMARERIPQVDYRALTASEWGVRTARRRWPIWHGSACPCSSSPRGWGRRSGSDARVALTSCRGALEVAFEHDSLAIIEAFASGIEVECSVLGNDEPVASLPGEILLATGEAGWYDYEAKYTPGGMELIVPARVSDAGARAGAVAGRGDVHQVRLPRAGAGRLLRAGRAGARQRARHDAGVHEHQRVWRRCSTPAGCRTWSCWTGWLGLAVEGARGRGAGSALGLRGPERQRPIERRDAGVARDAKVVIRRGPGEGLSTSAAMRCIT